MTPVASWPMVVTVVGVFLLVMVVVGVSRRRAYSTDVDGFVTGNRNLGAADMAGLLCGTMFSAFTFLGAPGLAFSRGGAILYVVAYGVLGVLPLYVLGPRLVEIGRRVGCMTQAQFITARFPSHPLRVLIALIGAGVALPYLALQMQGSGLIVEWLTGGQVNREVGAAAAFTVVTLYVSLGGVGAVARTSLWQAALMLAVAWGLGFYFPSVLHGGLGPMMDRLAATRPELLGAPGLGPDGTPWPVREYASAIISSALAFAMWPHLFMRVFAARSGQALRRAVAIFPLFQLILLPVVVVGLAGVGAVSVSRPDAVLLELVVRSALPGIAIGIVCAAALAAAMSTGDSILHCAASTAVEDIVAPVANVSDSMRRLLLQLAVPVVAALAFTLAITDVLPTVMLVIWAYGIVIQLAPPVYAALFWRRATTTGVILGMVGGLGVTMVLHLRSELRPLGLDAGLVGLTFNCLLLVIGSWLSKPQAESVLQPLEAEPATL